MYTNYLRIPDEKALNPAFDVSGGSSTLSFEDKEPNHFPFDIYEAYRIRLTSLCNGAIYAVNYAPLSKLSLDDKFNRIMAIKELHKKKMQQLDQFKKVTQGHSISFSTDLYNFYEHELPGTCGLKPRQLIIAEAFYIWQHRERPQRTTRFTRNLGSVGKLVINQMVHSRTTTLTQAQKEELLRIHDKDRKKHPKWFLHFRGWAKKSLLQIVPKQLDGDWSHYEKNIPTVLRRLPGEANSATHRFIITHEKPSGETITLSDTYVLSQGAPTSFNMKEATERQQSANENLAQMLAPGNIKETLKQFRRTWGLGKDNALPSLFPILLGGLITPSSQGGLISKIMDFTGISGDENNTLLAKEKETALADYLQKYPCADLKIFNLNVAINGNLSTLVKPDEEFIKFSTEFHQKMTAFLRDPQSNIDVELSQQRKNDLDLLQSVIQRLQELSTQKVKGRNRNFYLAALYDIAIRLMGGLSTGNCKSSKDRKGSELMLANTMLLYAAEEVAQGRKAQIPAFNDQSTARERFVDIFARLYTSGHQLLFSHDSTPGSLGIKNEGILDKDMIAKLESLRHGNNGGVYTLSRQMANLNKPGSFWKKQRNKIQLFVTLACTILAAAITIVLLATGVLSPFAIIGALATQKLGLIAASIIGGFVNLAIILGGVAAIVAAACKIRSIQETRRDAYNEFSSQEARIKSSPTPVKGGSTSKMSQNGLGSLSASSTALPNGTPKPVDPPLPITPSSDGNVNELLKSQEQQQFSPFSS